MSKKIDTRGITVYMHKITNKADCIVIHRMALHPFNTASKNCMYKDKRFNFRIAYSLEDMNNPSGTGFWRYSCLGADTRIYEIGSSKYGSRIGNGSIIEALQWLFEGEGLDK